MATAAVRQRNAERLPWVTRVEPQPCDGIKWGSVALADLYEHGPRAARRPARGIQPKSRCAKQGRWKFEALKESHARDGIYCWHHLISSGLYSDADEWERTNRWFEQNGFLDA